MADAKRCDMCGIFFDAGGTGYEVERGFGYPAFFGTAREWDVCSAACLVQLGRQQGGQPEVSALQVLDDIARLLETGADWRTVIGKLREAVVAMEAR